MKKHLRKKLLEEPRPIFSECLQGLEREALRIDSQGKLSFRPHPEKLGSALKHPHITTDFSESQIEYTTAPYHSLEPLLEELELLCNYARLQIKPERLWPFSMPAHLPEEKDIPIAQYGSSSLGRKKHIYRRGLAHRYGGKMQSISGVHYNFSFGKSFLKHCLIVRGEKTEDSNISESYLGVIRNFLRHIYVMPYLFGNSPAIHKSFIPENIEDKTQRLAWEKIVPFQKNRDSFYAKYATSLRQSEIGYNHPGQWNLKIDCNSLAAYLESMTRALSEENPAYKIWPLEMEEQLSYAHLQIENEHYAPIRPKKELAAGESALQALERKGIGYLELRCLDIQNESCCGVDPQALRFTQLLLYHCLLEDSPPIDSKEEEEIQKNYLKVVWEGRDTNCKLNFDSQTFLLKDRALALCEELGSIAEGLDTEYARMRAKPEKAEGLNEPKEKGDEAKPYTASLDSQIEKIKHPEASPSARFLDMMLSYPKAYIEFGRALAEKQSLDAEKHALTIEQKRKMEGIRISSLEKQSISEKQG